MIKGEYMKPININPKIMINPTMHTYMIEPPASLLRPISKGTKEFVQKMANSTTDVILRFISNNGKEIKLRSNDDKLYRYKNILLYRSNGAKAYQLEQNIKIFQGSGIAPRYVNYFELGKDDFLTVMETNGEKALPYRKNADRIAPEEKQKFVKRVQSLLDQGFVNREIFANEEAYLVTSNGEVLFADWSEVNAINKSEISHYNRFMKDWSL